VSPAPDLAPVPAFPLATYTPLPIKTSQTKKESDSKTEKSNKSVTAKESNTVKKATNKTSQPVVAGGVDRIKQTYIVRKGDTLSQIVWNQYHSFAYMDRVQQVNQIKDTDRIYIGQCILLPDP
ncbi:MAG: LysM peptidoglycan-binding domain-containing protein, partial [Lachnospiraceae bacterium]|nr:LysM peptidoglycan-binding domain-containing protein [Lachnospiraceae bacterium]